MNTALTRLSLVAWLALAGCASVEERDPRVDLHDTLRRDMAACGADTECLRRRQAAELRSNGRPAEPAKPAPVAP